MAIAFRAYDIQSEHNLLSKFGALNEEDLEKVRQAIDEAVPSGQISEVPILQRLLSAKRIPESEFNLNFLIGKFSGVSPGILPPQQIKEGAAAMYYSLFYLRDKLFGQQLNQTPHTPEP